MNKKKVPNKSIASVIAGLKAVDCATPLYTDPVSGVRIVSGKNELEAVYPDGTRKPAIGTPAQLHWATEGEMDVINHYDAPNRADYATKDIEELEEIHCLFFSERTPEKTAKLNALLSHLCCEIPRYLAWVELGRMGGK